MFQGKQIQQEQEFNHRNDEGISSSGISLPQGYILHQVDDELWESLYGNKFNKGHLLKNKIVESWNSFDDFMDRSLAFCVTYENHIVAVIVGTARFNHTLAIDIETDKEHQNKGLAFILTMKFVNECVSRGLSAQWDCVESNIKSKKLAEKAGFELIKQQPVFWFDI
ncbi:GNAT acetyltransferase [compost metagenome]